MVIVTAFSRCVSTTIHANPDYRCSFIFSRSIFIWSAEKMNLTVGSIGSHSFVGAAASHNGTIRCEWKCKVCVYILTESSGLVLIRRCRLLDWRLSVQRSAKGQTPAKKKKKRQKTFVLTRLVCFLCILTVHGCNLTSLMQLEQILYQERLCVGVYKYMHTHLHTGHKPPSAADAFHASPLVWQVEHGRQGATILLMLKVCISTCPCSCSLYPFWCGILVMLTLHLLTGPMTTYTYSIYIELLGVSVWMCLCQQKIKQTFTLEWNLVSSPPPPKKKQEKRNKWPITYEICHVTKTQPKPNNVGTN